jgi:alpha-tubulin suppressor-like RCC1 family protein
VSSNKDNNNKFIYIPSESIKKPCSLENDLKDDIKQIYAGKYTSFAVTKDGVIYSWG